MADYKDYTNIAGTPFQPYVTKQIEKRKELIKKENRSNSDLQWLTNKNVWIRISSGADVDNNNNPTFTEKGQGLARKYILQGGLTKTISNRDSDSLQLRSGIGPDGAYGIGGNDFGYRPMPGLTNLSINTGGKLGTLREATFEFTCYNREQLDIMSALYMRLGFSVLIEWGHTFFIKNDGGIETNIKPINFFGINTKEELIEKIQENRVLHSSNYDALWGTIKNFTYSLEDNGTFKCQVQLVGAGDILESLKINQSGNLPSTGSKIQDNQNDFSQSPYPVVSEANSSLLNELLFNIFLSKLESGNNIKTGTINYISDFSEDYKKVLKNYYNLNDPLYNINLDDFKQSNTLVEKGFHFSLLSKLNENNGSDKIEIPNVDFEKLFRRMIVGYEINGVSTTGIFGGSKDDIKKAGLEQVYITLGHLLYMIQSLGFIYDKVNNKTTPYIYIDINPETNRCYTFPGHCSLDPTVCLIGSQELPYKIESKFLDVLKQKFPFYDPSNSELGGRFMYTLVNLNFITSTLKKYSTQSEKGDVYFVDFIKDILSGISKACGGFNEFRIVPDDDTRCIRIFDDRAMPNFGYSIDKYLKIPVLGKESIVYNFSYTSKISPQMASQIVIAAQAQDGGVKTNKDALSFSHLNEGLINRLSPSRIEATTELNEINKEDNKESKYIELREFIRDLYDGTGGSKTQREIAREEEQKEAKAAFNRVQMGGLE